MMNKVKDEFRTEVGGQTTREVYRALTGYLEQRPDFGLQKIFLNLALEPASPFDPKQTRRLKKSFVLAVFLVLALAATFIYFNFWSV
jgi:hypothetical protein